MQVYEQITPQEHEAEVQEAAKPTSSHRGCPLILVQAFVCLLILLAAFVLRFFVPELYTDLRNQYEETMNQSILITADDISNS